jgi:hypothetical protein
MLIIIIVITHIHIVIILFSIHITTCNKSLTLATCFAIQSLLGEIESFELFAARTLATVNQTEKFLFAGICVAILLNELFNGQITTSNSDNNLVLLDFHEDSLLAILINTL